MSFKRNQVEEAIARIIGCKLSEAFFGVADAHQAAA